VKYLHFGPGPVWKKPNKEWVAVDIDANRGDILLNFNEFKRFDIPDNSIEGIYASHTFEHVSMFIINKLWKDCSRVLKSGYCMRIIVPDVVRSMKEYFDKNGSYKQFKLRKNHNPNWTLFECMKADFISQSGQPHLLGEHGLAHQNAWDFETMEKQLTRCGFSQINKSGFKKSQFNCFDFEGSYPSEANHEYRSMYVEAIK